MISSEYVAIAIDNAIPVCIGIYVTKFDHTVNGEKFAGLNISGFSGIKFFTEIFLTIPKYSVRGKLSQCCSVTKTAKV